MERDQDDRVTELSAAENRRKEEASEREQRMHQSIEKQIKWAELTRSVKEIQRTLEAFVSAQRLPPADVAVDRSPLSGLSANTETYRLLSEALEAKEAENSELRQEVRRLNLVIKDLSQGPQQPALVGAAPVQVDRKVRGQSRRQDPDVEPHPQAAGEVHARQVLLTCGAGRPGNMSRLDGVS